MAEAEATPLLSGQLDGEADLAAAEPSPTCTDPETEGLPSGQLDGEADLAAAEPSPTCTDPETEGCDKASAEPEPCPICMDPNPDGLLALKCGHVAHKACLEAMISARWTGKRITFNYMNCFMCRQQLEHPELESILAPHKKLRSKVMRISLDACQKEELIENLDALIAESPEQAEAAAAAEIACFECSECAEPFAAGRVDCGVEEGIDVSTLRCPECQWKSPSEYKCTKHGLDEAVIKCDWCCGIAMFKCSTGMYCSECHRPPYAHTMPLHDPNGSEERKVGQGQHCPGPGKCPLRLPHPPNGTGHRAFVIGCLHGCIEPPPVTDILKARSVKELEDAKVELKKSGTNSFVDRPEGEDAPKSSCCSIS